MSSLCWHFVLAASLDLGDVFHHCWEQTPHWGTQYGLCGLNWAVVPECRAWLAAGPQAEMWDCHRVQHIPTPPSCKKNLLGLGKR